MNLSIFLLASLAIAVQSASVGKVERGRDNSSEDKVLLFPGQPAEQPLENPAEQPLEQPAEQPLEQPAEQPLEQPAEQPLEQPAEQPIEQPAEVNCLAFLPNFKELEDSGIKFDEEEKKWVDAEGNEVSEDDLKDAEYRHFGGGGFGGFGGGRSYGGFGGFGGRGFGGGFGGRGFGGGFGRGFGGGGFGRGGFGGGGFYG
ncbi:unnamed protein product [Cyprideis torosa]|uniref:Uncharacterized protein n=1 Tax=Cyprideis torosa TaxID=163714 RepID=A0A7R8WE32_9CRUS|nr:unnamed protein product [Cyprideis torosa]CAG0895310.1 unnamed protein product [Cyprideis torosa]